MRRSTTLALAALVLAPCRPAAAQAEVSALARGTDPVETTDDLRISRFADFSEETSVSLGTRLDMGDLMTSVGGGTDVELTCGEATLLRFSGGFRVQINPPGEVDCAVDFLTGTLDVLTDLPTEVNSGGVTLGSEGTQYAVEITLVDAQTEPSVQVFDGRVNVRSRAGEQRIDTGATWRLARGRADWGRVGDAEAERAADRYARFDIAKSVAQGRSIDDRAATRAKLKALHRDVLMKPDDTGKRAELAREQIKYGGNRQATYNLRRARLTTPEQLEVYSIDPRVLTVEPRVYRMVTPAADPLDLIAAGKHQEAIDILRRRAETDPSSVVWFGLALAHSKLEGEASRNANGYAVRALRAHAEDRELSEEQAAACRRIQAAYRRAAG